MLAAGAAASVLHVRGTQTVIDENAGTFAMHGTLVGTWYTTSFVPSYDSPSLFAATGTEKFVGCVDANRDRHCGGSDPHGTRASPTSTGPTTTPSQERSSTVSACTP